MVKLVTGIVVLLVLVIGGFVIFSNNGQTPTGNAVVDLSDDSMAMEDKESLSGDSTEMEKTEDLGDDNMAMEDKEELSGDSMEMEKTEELGDDNMAMEDKESLSGDSMENTPVTFTLTGENFKFVMNGEDNPEIRVNEGDLVRIEFTSTSGFHDWVIDEFNAATEKVMDSDGSTYVEFIADQKGTFEYYCSVGQHRANGMKGTFIVG